MTGRRIKEANKCKECGKILHRRQIKRLNKKLDL